MDPAKWSLSVLATVLALVLGFLLTSIHAQNERIGDVQVRIASIDTALEILLDGYAGDSD